MNVQQEQNVGERPNDYYRAPNAPSHGHPPSGHPQGQPNQPSTMAWITLIAGIIGWVAVPVVAPAVAVVCGWIERQKIADGLSPKAGSTFVTIGLIMGGIQLALTVLVLMICCFVFAFFFLIAFFG